VTKRLRALALAAASISLLAISAPPPVPIDARTNALIRVSGTVGIRSLGGGALRPVGGAAWLLDDAFAEADAHSSALLVLFDDSVIGLGEATEVQAGPYAARPVDRPLEEIVLLLRGTIRADAVPGSDRNDELTVVTAIASIVVSDAIAIISSDGGGLKIACLRCDSGSIRVTVPAPDFSRRTIALSADQMLTSDGHTTTVSPLTTSALAAFSAAGVSTSTSSGIAAAIVPRSASPS